jgi:hypothetical protein
LNNFTTNKDIATKFEADLPHCVRNMKEKNVLLFKFRCNIFIGVRIIKEMQGSVVSGTPCTFLTENILSVMKTTNGEETFVHMSSCKVFVILCNFNQNQECMDKFY